MPPFLFVFPVIDPEDPEHVAPHVAVHEVPPQASLHPESHVPLHPLWQPPQPEPHEPEQSPPQPAPQSEEQEPVHPPQVPLHPSDLHVP